MLEAMEIIGREYRPAHVLRHFFDFFGVDGGEEVADQRYDTCSV